MTKQSNRGRPVPVPASRISRLTGLGRLAAGIASRTVFEGARRLSRGEIPNAPDLLLTSANITKVADELARMRGAALKLGQLLSMDAGDVLPQELATLMARVRADADFMPETQLSSVLEENWGPDWQSRFKAFEMTPIAAASIGQVHRATTRDGRDLAVKIQYPGVASSIDSDIDNAISLLSLTGLAPPKTKLQPLVSEAKRQLAEEADYIREAASIERFGRLVQTQPGFAMPDVFHDLSTEKIIAMSYVRGIPIEKVHSLDQEIRNDVVTQLFTLALDELFKFGVVQTDPNFANYVYDESSRTIGLLDFGAVREFHKEIASLYIAFLKAGLEGDRKRLRDLALHLRLYSNKTSAVHRGMIDKMVVYVFGAIRQHEMFDFTNDDLFENLRVIGTELALDRSFEDIPTMDVLYLQRKAAGLFFLGRRLEVKIPLREMLSRYVDYWHHLKQDD